MKWFAPLLLWAPTLFDQSVARILTRDFPQAQFILVDAQESEVLGKRWASDEPIAMGSLVKPFTALAMGRDPGHARCDPKHCWLPVGHGDLDLASAMSVSCNSYFLQKAGAVSNDAVASIAARFNLPVPAKNQPRTLIGLGGEWKISPERMASAFAALTRAPDASVVLEGMRRSAALGTARLLGGGAMAKTGTAPCSHKHKAPGDGYVAILYPAHAPRYVLLVQVHGVSGAQAAGAAARMLDVLRHGK